VNEQTVTDFDVAESSPNVYQAQVTRREGYVAPMATPADLLRIAVESGADLDRLERLMGLQERWEAKEAKRAFDAAFAAFKAEAVTIIKGRKVTDGPLKNKSYAELHDVVNAVTPALSKHGLSSSWKLTKDDKDWMEVTCYLRHVNGHEEYVSMGGPPDAGGAKNAIQARASTKTYLERYTLKAITGLSEQEDDDDGRGAGNTGADRGLVDKWINKVKSAKSEAEVRDLWAKATPELQTTNDLAAFNEVKGAVSGKIADFKAAEAK
jgi:hypothetical protein